MQEDLEAVFLGGLREVVGGPILPVGLANRQDVGVNRRRFTLAVAFLNQSRGDQMLAWLLPKLEVLAFAVFCARPRDDLVRVRRRERRDQPRAVLPNNFGTSGK